MHKTGNSTSIYVSEHSWESKRTKIMKRTSVLPQPLASSHGRTKARQKKPRRVYTSSIEAQSSQSHTAPPLQKLSQLAFVCSFELEHSGVSSPPSSD
ncbi:hypothetical protein BHE74_00045443, partial [Ensete ventricosum]